MKPAQNAAVRSNGRYEVLVQVLIASKPRYFQRASLRSEIGHQINMQSVRCMPTNVQVSQAGAITSCAEGVRVGCESVCNIQLSNVWAKYENQSRHDRGRGWYGDAFSIIQRDIVHRRMPDGSEDSSSDVGKISTELEEDENGICPH